MFWSCNTNPTGAQAQRQAHLFYWVPSCHTEGTGDLQLRLTLFPLASKLELCNMHSATFRSSHSLVCPSTPRTVIACCTTLRVVPLIRHVASLKAPEAEVYPI